MRKTHALDDLDAVVVDRNASRFLASVLQNPQRVEDVD